MPPGKTNPNCSFPGQLVSSTETTLSSPQSCLVGSLLLHCSSPASLSPMSTLRWHSCSVVGEGQLNQTLLQEKSAHYPALTKVKSIIASSNFSGNVFPLTRVGQKFLNYIFCLLFHFFTVLHLQEYSSWETDEVITRELVRNLGIALACVFITTLILLANFLGSVIVLVCVAVTLVRGRYFHHQQWQIKIKPLLGRSMWTELRFIFYIETVTHSQRVSKRTRSYMSQ